MGSSLIPERAAIAVADMLDNCVQVQPGQHVVLLGALDGLHGGRNLVDEQAIDWMAAGVQQRGAHPTIVWADMPLHPEAYWSRTSDAVPAWDLPPVVKGALSSADVVIGQVVDLWQEGEAAHMFDALRERRVPYVFNLATTAPLLASAFCLTPWELAAEIRIQAAKAVHDGAAWTITHPNGTQVRGTVVRGAENTTIRHTKYPEGVFPSLASTDAEGELVFDSTGPHWARHIGLPHRFSAPVRIAIEQGKMKDIRGGAEAEILHDFYKSLSKHLGDNAYAVRGFHGGCHPHASVTERECPDDAYRAFIEHHNATNVHLHLGDSHGSSYPFNVHVSAELPGATVTIGGQVVYENGRMPAFDHPEVQKIVARYPNRPGTDDIGAW